MLSQEEESQREKQVEGKLLGWSVMLRGVMICSDFFNISSDENRFHEMLQAVEMDRASIPDQRNPSNEANKESWFSTWCKENGIFSMCLCIGFLVSFWFYIYFFNKKEVILSCFLSIRTIVNLWAFLFCKVIFFCILKRFQTAAVAEILTDVEKTSESTTLQLYNGMILYLIQKKYSKIYLKLIIFELG